MNRTMRTMRTMKNRNAVLRSLQLPGGLRLRDGRVVQELWEGESAWQLTSDPVLVLDVTPREPLLVGAAPQGQIQHRHVWAIEVPSDGRPLHQSQAIDVYRVPADRAFVRLPMRRIGEGARVECGDRKCFCLGLKADVTWVTAAQAASHDARLERGPTTEH